MARILISDDYTPLREAYRRGLEQAGHEVFTAADGLQACQCFLDELPDVVITDWHMPVMNGLDLVLALRRLGHGAPIVLLSGGTTYLHGYLENVVVLRKPVSTEKLARLVEAMMIREARAPYLCSRAAL